jgi:F-type H+-transporting ATPase subunit O
VQLPGTYIEVLWYFVSQPPIKVFGIEGRYAHAIYSAASKKKSVDKVESELAEFQVCT